MVLATTLSVDMSDCESTFTEKNFEDVQFDSIQEIYEYITKQVYLDEYETESSNTKLTSKKLQIKENKYLIYDSEEPADSISKYIDKDNNIHRAIPFKTILKKDNIEILQERKVDTFNNQNHNGKYEEQDKKKVECLKNDLKLSISRCFTLCRIPDASEDKDLKTILELTEVIDNLGIAIANYSRRRNAQLNLAFMHFSNYFEKNIQLQYEEIKELESNQNKNKSFIKKIVTERIEKKGIEEGMRKENQKLKFDIKELKFEKNDLSKIINELNREKNEKNVVFSKISEILISNTDDDITENLKMIQMKDKNNTKIPIIPISEYLKSQKTKDKDIKDKIRDKNSDYIKYKLEKKNNSGDIKNKIINYTTKQKMEYLLFVIDSLGNIIQNAVSDYISLQLKHEQLEGKYERIKTLINEGFINK